MKNYFGKEEWIKAACYTLRYQVFVLEQGISPELEFDEQADSYDYFLILDGHTPVATLRYQLKTSDCIQPERFCVAKNYRHQGIGSQLLALAEEKAVQSGLTKSYLVAEMTATGFYEKQGYVICTQPFLEDGIRCVGMKKELLL